MRRFQNYLLRTIFNPQTNKATIYFRIPRKRFTAQNEKEAMIGGNSNIYLLGKFLLASPEGLVGNQKKIQ